MMGRDESLWRDRLGVSRETMDALAVYERLLKKWQARINLIGPATVDHIWTRHFLDSAQLIAHIRIIAPINCPPIGLISGQGPDFRDWFWPYAGPVGLIWLKAIGGNAAFCGR